MISWLSRFFGGEDDESVLEEAEEVLTELYTEMWFAIERVADQNPFYIAADEETGDALTVCAFCLAEYVDGLSSEHDDECGFRLCAELADLPAVDEEEDDA